MNKIVFIFIILLSISCKDSNEKDNFKKKPEKKIETIEDYIQLDNKENVVEVNDVLGESVKIENISVFKDKIQKKTFLVFKLSERIENDIKENYRIIVRTFPTYLDDLREDTEKRNLKYDSWYSKINEIENNGDIFFVVNLSESGGEFDKIILQLINDNTNEISKKRIYVRNVTYKITK
ncbi:MULTISPECIES: hypothetical protein [Mesoflavibacter]|uniref:hypothetical protein n=1 Tax=Mesoflavibacter TaxID=444051 RepID=UPI0003FA5511|nr:hypothetical protein [Mesoflavibacter zeaxanthinifaciens]